MPKVPPTGRREVGPPPSEFLTALIGFHVGVDLGQLAVIAIAFVTVGYQWHLQSWYPRRVAQPASASLACVGFFLTLERLYLG